MKINKNNLRNLTNSYLRQYGLDSQVVCANIINHFIKIKFQKITVCFFYNERMLVLNNETEIREQETFDAWKSFRISWGYDTPVTGFYSKKLIALNFEKNDFINKYWPFFLRMFELIEDQNLNFNNQKPISLAPLNDNIDQLIDCRTQDWYNKLLQEYTEYYQSSSKSDIVDRHYHEQARLHGLKFVIK